MGGGRTLALVGGTGLTELDEHAGKLDVETPYGSPSAPVRVIADEPLRLLFLPRHGSPHRYPPHCVNYRANLWALREAGADHVLAVYAVGGITADYAPGTLAAPDQLIDYTWGREQSYSDGGAFGLQHIEFTTPFSETLRSDILSAAEAHSIPALADGCVGVVQGPRLETDAEIRRLRRDGCDMVGMTSMPEAALARELGMKYASICLIANWAAGISELEITMEAIEETIRDSVEVARSLIGHLCR